jgi:uncharacterized protein (DUF1778 family)
MGNKENNKSERIYIRVSEKQKNKIQKKADKNGMKLSKFILRTLESPRGAVENSMRLRCLVQDICNHIEEKYGSDEYLERLCEELWESLS